MPPPDYDFVRRQAHALAQADAAAAVQAGTVGITEIDRGALDAFQSSWSGRHWSGYGGFDWVDLWHRYCRYERRSFHCALWSELVLCGLCVGTLPRTHSSLTIRFLEGRPQGHPLQGSVARIVLAAAEYYAEGLKLAQIRIENPAPALEPLYQSRGYTIGLRAGAVRYLVKTLQGNSSSDEPDST